MKLLLLAMGMTSAFILVVLTISDPVIQSVWLVIGSGVLMAMIILVVIKFIVWALEDL